MRIDVVTVFPGMIASFVHFGVLGRAVQQKRIQVYTYDVRDYADAPLRNVDDRPYGGGDGMVMLARPAGRALQAAKAAQRHPDNCKAIYLSAQGKPLTQAKVNQLAQLEGMILLCGRYKGVDERVIDMEIDEECSLGDYVISGGEPAAMVLIDAVARQCPGVLGNEDSLRHDSFVDGLLDGPYYTRPMEYRGQCVPAVLMSGNHAEIARWRRQRALGRTQQRRPDLLKRCILTAEDRELLDKYVAQHRLRQYSTT